MRTDGLFLTGPIAAALAWYFWKTWWMMPVWIDRGTCGSFTLRRMLVDIIGASRSEVAVYGAGAGQPGGSNGGKDPYDAPETIAAVKEALDAGPGFTMTCRFGPWDAPEFRKTFKKEPRIRIGEALIAGRHVAVADGGRDGYVAHESRDGGGYRYTMHRNVYGKGRRLLFGDWLDEIEGKPDHPPMADGHRQGATAAA